MKQIILLLSIGILFVGCSNDSAPSSLKFNLQKPDSAENAAIETDNKTAHLKLANNQIDFGKVNRKKNPDVLLEVEFTNTGKNPLVILKADVSCGCVSIDYPKAPVLSGQTNILKIKVDLRAQEGVFDKKIFIKSNADNDVVLIHILGNIKK